MVYANIRSRLSQKIHVFCGNIKSLPSAIWPVVLANMLLAIATTMTFSISPLFMTSVLGITVLSMGAMEGFTEGLSQVSKLFSGTVTDYKGRKKSTFLFGVGLAALSKPLFILAGGVGAVMASKVLERVSNGVISTPRDAYVATVAGNDNRGGAIGMVMAGRTLGCVIGPFLVAALMIWIQDYRALLWIGFIPVILAFAIIWFYMKEGAPQDAITSAGSPGLSASAPPSRSKLSLKDVGQLPRSYWTLLGVASLFMFARFNDGILTLRLQELGAPSWICVSTIGFFNGVSLLCSYPIGRLSDKMDRSKLLYFSYITLFLCNICFIVAWDTSMGLLGLVFWGAQRGTSQILFTAMVADAAPARLMGTSMGLFNILIGVMSLLAGTIGGFVAHHVHLTGTFVFGMGVSGVATLALIWRHLAEKKQARQIQETPQQNQNLQEVAA